MRGFLCFSNFYRYGALLRGPSGRQSSAITYDSQVKTSLSHIPLLRCLNKVFGARASWRYKIVMAQALKICASNARALKQNCFP